MNPAHYSAALRREGAKLADSAASDLSLPVPSCPEWNVADLVWHTGEVHCFWRSIASGEIDGPDGYVEPQRPHDSALVEWFGAGVEETASVLERLDPATPMWTWAAQQDAAFIQRRMAQETAVHCWDALAAAGRPEPVERSLAADGIEEFLEFMLTAGPPSQDERDGAVRLAATDHTGRWSARCDDGAWRAAPPSGTGDAAVEATASDLLLLLWRRIDADAVRVQGDRAVLHRFLAAADLD
ncbi:uncharacterized protein (TIGR03083 family) [Spinactinospora alkalitolerans]|uniref:Uncharacterized protein (TIGR03083 family) n=1 Tax=Spinactinospora alkalitolerans TaxID=687207 RepID=A0A852TYA4_9ACTN|nr:maleylpyruvate isomerase family mycothiol-dependent enzyme [Spinactinospora alkalitolerans]NYE47783.1 uncharacterized protein (TIGR03083 family) [Spinactinospora alkalitolerans]